MTNYERPTSGIYRFRLNDLHVYGEICKHMERSEIDLMNCLNNWDSGKGGWAAGCLLHDAYCGMAYAHQRLAEFNEAIVNDAAQEDWHDARRIWHSNRAREILAEAKKLKEEEDA